MKRHLLCTIGLLLASTWGVLAATFPTVSTTESTSWYVVQFSNGGNVLTATTSGAKVTTATLTGSDAQYWKVEGSATAGYTLTSKSGLKLYSTTTAQNGMFYASTAPTSNYLLNITNTTNTSYSGAFEITPKSNTAVGMNQWGGAGSGKDLGLWSVGDGNNPLTFISQAEVYQQLHPYSIIPYPTSITTNAEGSLALNTLTSITYTSDSVKTSVTNFADALKTTSGINLTVSQSPATRLDKAIYLQVDAALGAEAYTLTVDANGVIIKASKPAGFFYALQTIKQLLPAAIYGSTLATSATWTLPLVTINDSPQLSYRGYMLDIARHYFDKNEVKKVLDIMSVYKMNRLHWHLTDDQGWRIEIPEYPRLTSVGSIRSGSLTNKGQSTKFYDDTEYGRGMWYSLNDLKEIVSYAKDRYIEIMPEVDLPGHMVAALASYPVFSCDTTKTYSVRVDEGISQDVLNIGKDTTITFLKTVLGHLAEIFPYQYIHLGGDECPTTQWASNADCLKRVSANNLTGVNQLQTWLVEQLGTWLKTKYNKDIVVWDELLSHWSSTNTIKPVIMAWNSIGKSADAANAGMKSIVVPYQSLYLDMMQVPVSQADVNEQYQGGWGDGYVNSVQTVYGVNPVSSLSGKESYCMGVQGNMWTETTCSNQQLEYQLLPRLLALSETGWLPASKKSWTSFYTRLQTQADVLNNKGLTYARHYFATPAQSAVQSALSTADSLLTTSVRGEAGYPVATAYDALNTAYTTLKADTTQTTAIQALQTAITTFKSAELTQPAADKVYQIVSASTYYKRLYAGSTVYESNGTLKFHYTKQLEPEELWQFVAKDGGYVLTNYSTGHKVSLPTYNANSKIDSISSTTLRIDRATVANGKYSYVPGSVTLSSVSGYSVASTGNIARLYGAPSGIVISYNDPSLCNPGTWKLVEVTDFKEQLQGLVNKCQIKLDETTPGAIGQPSVEACNYLQTSLITPATALIGSSTTISQEQYNTYMAVYEKFLAMPMASVLDNISAGKYYYLQNAYFTNYYAKANANGTVTPATLSSTEAGLRWQLVRNTDGSCIIYNKGVTGSAYITSTATTTAIKIGTPGTNSNKWTLAYGSTDQGGKSLNILESSGTNSWYINASAFANVILQPASWGASIWNLVDTGEAVPTALTSTKAENIPVKHYDLQGRQVNNPTKGLYITSDGRKILIP